MAHLGLGRQSVRFFARLAAGQQFRGQCRHFGEGFSRETRGGFFHLGTCMMARLSVWSLSNACYRSVGAFVVTVTYGEVWYIFAVHLL